jgi:clathrin heavy chain
VAIELAWRNGYTDFAMPYIIQYMRHLHEKVHKLDERTAPPAPEDEAAREAAAVAASIYGAPLMMGMGNDTLMLQNGSAYGNGYGQQQGGIPDPYQQQQQYGAQAYGGGYGGAGGGYY